METEIEIDYAKLNEREFLQLMRKEIERLVPEVLQNE